MWLLCALFYWHATYQGVFAPSDPLVFQHPAYDNCRIVDIKNNERTINNQAPKALLTYNWYTCADLKGEYTTFSPLAYSLDVILPLVDLGQEKTWGTYIGTPKPNMIEEFGHVSLNHLTRLLLWFEILFGWIASLVLVAVLTGLTDSAKPK